jgi:hypothetical protein
VVRVILVPPRLAVGSARLGWRASRFVGLSRAGAFALGVGTGVLLASPGARRAAAKGVAAVIRGIAKAREEDDPAHVAAPVDGPVLPVVRGAAVGD